MTGLKTIDWEFPSEGGGLGKARQEGKARQGKARSFFVLFFEILILILILILMAPRTFTTAGAGGGGGRWRPRGWGKVEGGARDCGVM